MKVDTTTQNRETHHQSTPNPTEKDEMTEEMKQLKED